MMSNFSFAQIVDPIPVNLVGSSDPIAADFFLHIFTPSPLGGTYHGGVFYGATKEKWGYNISGLTPGTEYSLTCYYMMDKVIGTPALNRRGDLAMLSGAALDIVTINYITEPNWRIWYSVDVTFTALGTTDRFEIEADGATDNSLWLFTDVSALAVDISCDPLTTTATETEICLGEALTFTSTSINGGAITWDGGITNGVPFTPVTAGTFTYHATSDFDADCIDSVTFIVNPLPVVVASVDFAEICLGDDVIFTGSGADTYVWDLGVSDGVAFTPAALGTETYTVTGTNTTTGCENTATVDVTVNDNPVVTAAASPDEICIGESITFTGGGADTYTWDGGITDGVAFTPAGVGPFTYTVTGTIGASGCENTATVDIIVNDLPVVTASVDDDEICEGESITFTGGGADSYTWDMGVTDGVAFTPAAPGTVTYTVTGTNATTTCENTATIDVTVNALPVVIAAVDFTEICLGEDVTFTGSGADSYVWDLGVTDGIAFTPAGLGTETYTVTGTNATTGCENTASIDVTVNDNPVVTATASPTEICIGESTTFTGGGADTYIWDGGVTDGVSFTPAAVGTFTFNVTGTIGGSGCENTATVDIIVHDLPTVTASVDDDEICEGESAIFTGGGADSYTWDLGVTDGIAFTPPAPGTVTYTVTGTTAEGCSSTATIDLTVNASPTVTASASEIEICLGDAVILNGGGADTYVWDGGVTDGAPFTPLTAGTFTFIVEGTSTEGCSGSTSIDILVIECEDVIAAFAFNNNLCIGDCITLTDESIGTILNWDWDFGGAVDPSTSTDQNPFICFNTVGVFEIQLTVTNINGTTSSVVNSITVNELPNLTARNDTIIDLGDYADLIATSTSTGLYSWSPDFDVYCDECPITTANPQDSTTYTVTFIDENGCKAEAEVMVLVNIRQGIGVPTAFSPNNDGNNDVLFVKGYGIESLSFRVYNRYGEKVFQSDLQNIGWDGTFKNRDENPGVFTWVLIYNMQSGAKGKMQGNTTLIR